MKGGFNDSVKITLTKNEKFSDLFYYPIPYEFLKYESSNFIFLF